MAKSHAYDPIVDEARRTFDHARDTVRQARKTAEAGRRQAPDIASEIQALIAEQLARWRGQGREAAHDAGDQLDHARQAAEERVEDARLYVVDRVQEHPLTATLAVLGAGVVLGLLLAGGKK